MNARFISIEGIDGAGKSTHLPTIADWLGRAGQEVVVTREPGGTDLAERLRELVLGQDMDALTEALLVFAARRDHVQRVIEPALARGAAVLCDRFADASFAYQGSGRGFDWQRLATLEDWVLAGRQPELTLWFDLPAETAATRRSSARAPDRFESEQSRFFERVRQGYRRRQLEAPGRIVCIDASGAPDEVGAKVKAALQARWP